MIKFLIVCAIAYALYKTFAKPQDHVSRVQRAGEKFIAFQKEVQAKQNKTA